MDCAFVEMDQSAMQTSMTKSKMKQQETFKIKLVCVLPLIPAFWSSGSFRSDVPLCVPKKKSFYPWGCRFVISRQLASHVSIRTVLSGKASIYRFRISDGFPKAVSVHL